MKKIISQSNIESVSQIIIGDSNIHLNEFLHYNNIVVITDANVYRYNDKLIDKYPHIIITSSEESKTLDTVSFIVSKLIDMQADREVFLLGIGGGIVTDITGFVASIYMRGVKFGFVPTTLLSQVDASVGGKNGVNFDSYKNMVGVFNQPEFVFCDTSLLHTLNDRDFACGLAEIIKASLICDIAMFEELERRNFEEIRKDNDFLSDIVCRSISIKADIVGRDLCETSERKKLNLGHTFAHAIEKQTREFTHGEAVSIGLAMIGEVSLKMGLLSIESLGRIKNTLQRYNLPIECEISRSKLTDSIRHDKKKSEDKIALILNNGLGNCEIRMMTFEQVDAVLV